MKISEERHTIIFQHDSTKTEEIVREIETYIDQNQDKNIIVDLSHKKLKPSDFIELEKLAQYQKIQKKSFVVVGEVDFDEIYEEIIVVPTLQEAHDFIEMDEIERDLGF